MTEAAEKLKPALVALPAEDRAELATFLMRSLDDQTDPAWNTAWIAELDRRWHEIESGQTNGAPAGEVFRKLQEKYS